jgi:fatty-acyl-CoA synthase
MGLYPALTKDMTLAEAFGLAVELRGDREALVCGDTRLTYRQLWERSEQLAQGLARLGVRKGERVAALLEPGATLAALFFAVARLGAVIIPIYTQLRPQGVAAVLEHAQPLVLVTDRVLAEGTLPPGGLPVRVIYADGAPGSPSLEEVLAGQPVELTCDVAATDLLALLYTSGTTGTPKATMHSHRSLIAPVVATLRIRQYWMGRPSLKTLGEMGRVAVRYRQRLLRAVGQPQTLLATGGWHNTTGLEAMLQALLMGERLVVLAHFEPRAMMRLIEQERVTILLGVPMVFQVLLSLPDFDRYDTSSLLICGTGAAPCPPQLAREIQRRFGCAVHIGFGATETGGGIAVTSLADSEARQAETVGRPLPGMEVKIVDEARRPLPPGAVGELAVRSDSIMLGYYRAPELTAEVLDAEGWYYTGDLAVLDEDGYLRIVGRKRDLIIRGGQNIFPQEIEHYLVAHPKIREAAVVGVPSPVGGESVVAFVIPEAGGGLTPQDVLEYCRAGLEPYQIPAQVRLVDDFPRAATGKPQKHLLRAQAMADLEGGNPP